jgi:hypothetical protein
MFSRPASGLGVHFCATAAEEKRVKSDCRLFAPFRLFLLSLHPRIYISSGHKGTDAIFICEPRTTRLSAGEQTCFEGRAELLDLHGVFSFTSLSRGGRKHAIEKL